MKLTSWLIALITLKEKNVYFRQRLWWLVSDRYKENNRNKWEKNKSHPPIDDSYRFKPYNSSLN